MTKAELAKVAIKEGACFTLLTDGIKKDSNLLGIDIMDLDPEARTAIDVLLIKGGDPTETEAYTGLGQDMYDKEARELEDVAADCRDLNDAPLFSYNAKFFKRYLAALEIDPANVMDICKLHAWVANGYASMLEKELSWRELVALVNSTIEVSGRKPLSYTRLKDEYDIQIEDNTDIPLHVRNIAVLRSLVLQIVTLL